MFRTIKLFQWALAVSFAAATLTSGAQAAPLPVPPPEPGAAVAYLTGYGKDCGSISCRGKLVWQVTAAGWLRANLALSMTLRDERGNTIGTAGHTCYSSTGCVYRATDKSVAWSPIYDSGTFRLYVSVCATYTGGRVCDNDGDVYSFTVAKR